MKIWQIMLMVVVALLGLLYIYLKTLKKVLWENSLQSLC